MNKKGEIGILIFFFIVVAVLITLGIVIGLVSVAIDYVADITVPEIENIGMVGSANITEYAQYSIVPFNNVIQNFTWLSGAVYMIGILGLIGLAFGFRLSMNRMFIVLFIFMALLMILVTILISNMYEDIYNGNDELSDRLKEHTLLSFLVLRSPLIFTIVIFVSGIILFSGMQQEEYV